MIGRLRDAPNLARAVEPTGNRVRAQNAECGSGYESEPALWLLWMWASAPVVDHILFTRRRLRALCGYGLIGLATLKNRGYRYQLRI